MNHIYDQIALERKRQDEKWGEQNFKMFSILYDKDKVKDVLMRQLAAFRENNEREKQICWYTILEEEICEAFLEPDLVKARAEMIQVCAVGVQIIEALDRQIDGGKV